VLRCRPARMPATTSRALVAGVSVLLLAVPGVAVLMTCHDSFNRCTRHRCRCLPSGRDGDQQRDSGGRGTAGSVLPDRRQVTDVRTTPRPEADGTACWVTTGLRHGAGTAPPVAAAVGRGRPVTPAVGVATSHSLLQARCGVMDLIATASPRSPYERCDARPTQQGAADVPAGDVKRDVHVHGFHATISACRSPVATSEQLTRSMRQCPVLFAQIVVAQDHQSALGVHRYESARNTRSPARR
jgi:hypothetical protein